MRFSCRAASHTHDYLMESGCLLEQCGVDEGCIVLLRTLHVGSWFSVCQLTSAVKDGCGRHGCKIGPTMDNGVYDILVAILTRLKQMDLCSKLKRVGDAFWSSRSGSSDETVAVLDSAFIDDDFMAIRAPSAEQLRAPHPCHA